ncbi:unnamed protein product [marine sediment metagenome]|uniref:Uncharacterized protein n=1 Tax=marine sediment metagenome TaxID=412755 RepID=X0TQK7_9ZZZZ
MKKLERIFLYTVLAILVFYVFLVDGNVESKMAIQEEIKARRIAIVNDVGQEVVKLLTNDEDNGVVQIYNGVVQIYNKDGTLVAEMRVSKNDNGEILVGNKNNKVIGSLP